MKGKEAGRLVVDGGLILDDQLYTRPEAAGILSCSVNYLAKDAMKETPTIPFIKLSPKFVRYRGSVLRGFMSR